MFNVISFEFWRVTAYPNSYCGNFHEKMQYVYYDSTDNSKLKEAK